MNREQAIDFGLMWLDMNDDAKDSQTYQFFKIATELLKNVSLAKPEWISTTEKLPEEHVRDDGYVEPSDLVLIKTVNGNVTVSRYWGNRYSKISEEANNEPPAYYDWVEAELWEDDVVKWMPLPE